MLRIAAFFALVACAAAATFDEAMLTVPASILAFEAGLSDGVSDMPTNQTFYFPCDGLAIKYKQDLDIPRDLGLWFMTNVAFSTSHRINPADVQDSITRNIGCQKSSLNVQNNSLSATIDTVYRQNITFNGTIPFGGQVINGNTLRFVRTVYPARQGDFGWWIIEYFNATSNNRFLEDVFIVDTDYTNFKIAYTCADIPVPFTADTAREQRWVIQRRQPWNFSAAQIIAMKLDAGLHGIIDFDTLYTFPTDQC